MKITILLALRIEVYNANVRDTDNFIEKYPVILQLRDPKNIDILFDFITYFSDVQAKRYIKKILCENEMEESALLSYLSETHCIEEGKREYNLAYYAFSLNKLRTFECLVDLGAPMESLSEIMRCAPSNISCKYLQEIFLAETEVKNIFVRQFTTASYKERQEIIFAAIKKNNAELLKFLWLLEPEGKFLFIKDNKGSIPLHYVIWGVEINSGNVVKAQLKQLFRRKKVTQLTYRNSSQVAPLHAFFALYNKNEHKKAREILVRLYIWLFGSSLDYKLISIFTHRARITINRKHAKLTLKELEKMFDKEIKYCQEHKELPAEERNLFLYIAKLVNSDMCFNFYQHANIKEVVIPLLNTYKKLAKFALDIVPNIEDSTYSVIRKISETEIKIVPHQSKTR